MEGGSWVEVIGDDRSTRDADTRNEPSRRTKEPKEAKRERNEVRNSNCGEIISHPALALARQLTSPRPFLNNSDFRSSKSCISCIFLFLNCAMPPKASEGSPQPSTASSFFTVPPPIKKLFDKFPLATYPANDLPQRSPTRRQGNQLFVFTDAAGARNGRPSFNPQCLKWQVSEQQGRGDHQRIAGSFRS